MENLHASLDSTRKVYFPKFPPDASSGGQGVHSTTFDPELRNEVKKFSNSGGYIPQLFVLNSEMKDLH